MLLFFSRFSTRVRFAAKKYRGPDHAVDPPVDGVESRFSSSPLLYHNYRPVSEFRGHGTKVLLRKNIIPSFEDTGHKETVCRVYPEKGEAHKTPSEFIALI